MRRLLRYTRLRLQEILRYPSFVLPTMGLPLLFYLIFGTTSGADPLPLVFGYLAFSMLGTAVFHFGAAVAAEREQPWSLYLLSLPASGTIRIASLILANIALTVLFAAPIAIAGLLLGAFAGSPGGTLTLGSAALLLGAVVQGAFGLVLGYWLPVKGAGPIATVLYFPLAALSGLWGGMNLGVLSDIGAWLPTGAWTRLINSALASEISWPALGLLGGYLILFTALGVLGYQRIQQTVYR